MSDRPSAAWYLAPIFLGIIGSAIMWYVLKDEDHPDSPKMIKKGWVIGIALTVIPFIVVVPVMLVMPWHSMDFDQYMERKMMKMMGQGMMNDPQVQQQMMQQLNTMMSDPELRQQMMTIMMQNPQMMEAMMQNQQFMQQLNP